MGEYTEIVETRIRARAGSELSRCCREAALLALERNEKVVLVHNEKSYNADPRDITRLILSTEYPPTE